MPRKIVFAREFAGNSKFEAFLCFLQLFVVLPTRRVGGIDRRSLTREEHLARSENGSAIETPRLCRALR